MASIAYNVGKKKLAEVGCSTAVLKVLLLQTISTAPNNPDEPDIASIAALLSTSIAIEFSDTNYQAGATGTGRLTVANVTVTSTNANNRAEITFDTLTWTSLGGTQTARAGVLYYHLSTADSSNIPLGYLELPDVATNGQNFSIVPGSAGVIQLTS